MLLWRQVNPCDFIHTKHPKRERTNTFNVQEIFHFPCLWWEWNLWSFHCNGYFLNSIIILRVNWFFIKKGDTVVFYCATSSKSNFFFSQEKKIHLKKKICQPWFFSIYMLFVPVSAGRISFVSSEGYIILKKSFQADNAGYAIVETGEWWKVQFASMQMHLQEKVISLRLIIIRNGEDMLLINFPLDKLSSVLADTGQIPDSLSHLGPFKEDVSSIVLIKKNMSPLLSIAFNHLISYQNDVFSLPVGISALGKSIWRTTISP